MKKIDEAVAKMAKECEGKDYLIPFEEHLTEICTNDRIAEKILQEEKTLQGSYEAMAAVARKRNTNYVSDEEGFAIIEEYFGITADDKGRGGGGIIDITQFL